MSGSRVSRIGAGLTSLSKVVSELKGQDLHTLCLHANSISRIEGLHMLRNLRDLNLSSNHISQMDGLQTLTALTKLNLASNRLTRVDSLHHLVSLQSLNLAYNAITHLSGLSGLQVQTPGLLSVFSQARQAQLTFSVMSACKHCSVMLFGRQGKPPHPD